MKKTVKEIFDEGRAVNLMTPMGYVFLSAEQVKDVINGKAKEIPANAGVRDCRMHIPVEHLLECVIVKGGYNESNQTNEYLVEYPKAEV